MDLAKDIASLVSMPVAVLVVGLVATVVLRAPIGRLLDRTRKISKTGLETDAPAQFGMDERTADEFYRFFDNSLLVQREDVIRDSLESLEFREPTDRERFLIRLLAASAISQQFERAYWNSWGSQLGALQFLNTLGAEGAEVEWLTPWYEQSAARDPQAEIDFSFEQWVGFLETHQLAVQADDRLVISIEGREFLKYILHQGYPMHRAG